MDAFKSGMVNYGTMVSPASPLAHRSGLRLAFDDRDDSRSLPHSLVKMRYARERYPDPYKACFVLLSNRCGTSQKLLLDDSGRKIWGLFASRSLAKASKRADSGDKVLEQSGVDMQGHSDAQVSKVSEKKREISMRRKLRAYLYLSNDRIIYRYNI
ncbi:hypothetical protein PIB30_005718 [Stylosanthes scabra]|uniref:Uncharacterized protein n=1 Tax=Stylosanthes scabra TaxID=79078 RepID=A0ABU6V328_9FABA|nr:hypothetical protein [Stylosanthes scabra]